MQDFQYHGELTCSLRLKTALAKLFNNRFDPVHEVTPNHILAGGGCSAILNCFFRAVADAGDGVLIAAPYYVGFDMDLTLNNNVVPIPVPVSVDEFSTHAEIQALEKKLAECKRDGVKVKAVLLCNPQNPLGRCYTREMVIAYAQFCEQHNLHLLSDEIYALSIFKSNHYPNPPPFVSALSVDFKAVGVNPERVHVAYAMSKDFNANGFRVGIEYA